MDIKRLKRRAAAHGLVVRRNVVNPVTLAGMFKYGTFPTGRGRVMSMEAFPDEVALKQYLDELDNVAALNADHPLVI